MCTVVKSLLPWSSDFLSYVPRIKYTVILGLLVCKNTLLMNSSLSVGTNPMVMQI